MRSPQDSRRTHATDFDRKVNMVLPSGASCDPTVTDSLTAADDQQIVGLKPLMHRLNALCVLFKSLAHGKYVRGHPEASAQRAHFRRVGVRSQVTTTSV